MTMNKCDYRINKTGLRNSAVFIILHLLLHRFHCNHPQPTTRFRSLRRVTSPRPSTTNQKLKVFKHLATFLDRIQRSFAHLISIINNNLSIFWLELNQNWPKKSLVIRSSLLEESFGKVNFQWLNEKAVILNSTNSTSSTSSSTSSSNSSSNSSKRMLHLQLPVGNLSNLLHIKTNATTNPLTTPSKLRFHLNTEPFQSFPIKYNHNLDLTHC